MLWDTFLTSFAMDVQCSCGLGGRRCGRSRPFIHFLYQASSTVFLGGSLGVETLVAKEQAAFHARVCGSK